MKFYSSSHIEDTDVYFSSATFDPYSIRGLRLIAGSAENL